jgi:hypothetical protein
MSWKNILKSNDLIEGLKEILLEKYADANARFYPDDFPFSSLDARRVVKHGEESFVIRLSISDKIAKDKPILSAEIDGKGQNIFLLSLNTKDGKNWKQDISRGEIPSDINLQRKILSKVEEMHLK